jgi:hypothetical protein
MDVNIDYYGHSVTVEPSDVADRLKRGATARDVREVFAEVVSEAVYEDPGEYRYDSADSDFIVEVLALVNGDEEADEDAESEDEDD